MPLVALCADIDLRREPNCMLSCHLHKSSLRIPGSFKLYLLQAASWKGRSQYCSGLRNLLESFVVAFLAANRKWERYKMDNYEDHYDMSCPSTIVSHCLSNRENEIPIENIETSRNDRLRYEGHEGHEKSQLLGVSPSSFSGMLPQMPQMPHIPGIPGMGPTGPTGPMQTPSRQMQMRPRGNWVFIDQWWHKRAMISGIFRNHNSKDSKATASSFHESLKWFPLAVCDRNPTQACRITHTSMGSSIAV